MKAERTQLAFIPFCKPHVAGSDQLKRLILSDGVQVVSGSQYSNEAIKKLTKITKSERVRLMPSCSAALETAILALDIKPNDEVIMPSFTFTSTANAVVLRGGIPVFVDIDPDTMNIDPSRIEPAITKKTKAILIVHYAGNAADMDSIIPIAKFYNLPIVEDAAQCIGAFYGGMHLGTIGDLGTFSFHYTKNVTCGEGGALTINNAKHEAKIDILVEKGTNRSAYVANKVSHYRWVDVGSSFIMSEITAAALDHQLQHWKDFTKQRLELWNYYNSAFLTLNLRSLRLPTINKKAQHNGHIYYLHAKNKTHRDKILASLADDGIQATTHYEPLHNAPAGRKYSRTSGSLAETEKGASTIIRLPLWHAMSTCNQNRVIKAVEKSSKKYQF